MIFRYKPIQSNELCQNCVQGYKLIDGEILAFYIRHKEDLCNIRVKDSNNLYSRLISGYGVYILFKKAHDNRMQVYVGRSTQGVSRCTQHIQRRNNSDIRIYDKWDSVIYFTSDDTDWSTDNIIDIERILIRFFKSNTSKWESLNVQLGNYATSNIEDLNIKISAIVSFLKEERFEFIFQDIKTSEEVLDGYLEETAKSAIEIRKEAEKEAKQEFKADILSKLNEDAIKAIKFYKKCEEFDDFSRLVEHSSNYIMCGRIYDTKKSKKDLAVITPLKYGHEVIKELPEYLFDGKHKFIDIATKSGSLLIGVIDRLMSEDKTLPINQEKALKEDWNTSKLTRLKHIISNLIFGEAISYKAYLITCENIIKAINKYVKKLNTVYLLEQFNTIPNIKYSDEYMLVVHSKDKNKVLKIEKVIRSEFGEDMKFDVTLGNPPYNNDMYLDFVRSAYNISEEYTCMIIPAKWSAKRGRENDRFREDMVKYISKIVWYPNSRDIFEIYEAGGICYTIQDKNIHNKKLVVNRCELNNALNSEEKELEYKEGQGVFGERIKSIVDKCSVNKNVTSRTRMKQSMYLDKGYHGGYNGEIEVYDGDKLGGLVSKSELKTDYALDKYKVIMHVMPGFSMAYLNDSIKSADRGKALGMNKVVVIKPNQVPSANFQILGIFETELEANSYKSYLETKLCRFLNYMGICSNTITPEFLRLIPDIGKYEHIFTDKEVYDYYKLSNEDIELIEAVIKDR